MLRKKISMVLCTFLVLGGTLNVRASNDTPNDNVVNNVIEEKSLNNTTLNKNDLNIIKKSINNIISSDYELLKTGIIKNYENLINNPKLSNLIDVTNKFRKSWYEKVDLKIKDYESDVTIDKIHKTSNNIYVADITYKVKFRLDEDNPPISEAIDHYRFEIESIDNNYYINKMINLDEDIKNNVVIEKVSTFKNSIENFYNYDEIIDSKTDEITNRYLNIDDYYQNFKEVNKLDSENYNNFLESRSYGGYNSSSAVSYARAHANEWEYNRDYHNFIPQGRDCTNYVSQCVHAGGIPTTSYWFGGIKCKAWNSVTHFYDYMKSNGYTSGGDSMDNARIGDVTQLYRNGNWSHSIILTARTSAGWLFCGHSTTRKDYPYNKAYSDGGYTNARAIKFWH